VLFFLWGVFTIVTTTAFMGVREPPGVTVEAPTTATQLFKRAGHLLRQDKVFRRYIAARISLSLASIALPFYAVYARTGLGAPEGMVGVYVSVRVGAMLLSNLAWGRLSDAWGNRLAMRLMTVGNGLTVLLALLLLALVGGLRLQGAWLPYLAIPIFFLDGAVRPAQMMTGNNFLLELAPEAELPLYMGISNTIIGIALLFSGLGGILADLFGFVGVFVVSLGLYVIGYVLATALPEPRAA
jgi:MFS family permease